ncbi:MAG: M48 family metallopeptidase [Bergeyella sp.]
MMKKILFGFVLFFHISAYTQSYLPIDTADYAMRKEFLTAFKKRNEEYIKTQKARHSGRVANEVSKHYTEYFKDFEKEIKNKDYAFRTPFNEMLNDILAKLMSGNPQIPSDMKILIAKDNTPNASCLPDGTFIIHMGLFNWMDNEEQIASVLSHEIAHKLKEHSLNSIIANLQEEKKDTEKVKEIKTSTVNRYDKAFDVLKDRLYRQQGKSRKHEIQADSLGYVLYSKAGFKKSEFINAMKNLRDFDSISPRVLKEETYRKLYTLPNLPFKDKWLKGEDFSLYNYDFYKEKLDKDSLSSHPEFTERISEMEKYFLELKTEEASGEASEGFKNLRKTAKMEILPNFYQSEDYGVGIYVAMQMIQDEFEEGYVKSWIGKFFGKIRDGRKNYNLNRYLDRVDPKKQSESYQQFLGFMWNLNLDEISSFADYYQKKP